MARPQKIVEIVLSWTVGGLFVYAGVIKFLHPQAFLADIESYRLVPYRIAYFVALYLPALEIVTGAGLFVVTIRRECSVILLALTILFIGALASAWARGIDISCGCFGKSEASANYPLLIGRDVLILGGIIWPLMLVRQRRKNMQAASGF